MIALHTLPNGLRVVLETIPFVRSVSFGIWVKTGSRNETADTNGISHFIEHMMFKGTKNRTARQIADEMDAIGGQLNAFTSRECTCFFSRTLDTHFDTALDCLQDMFFNSNFDEADIDKERGIILEEINMLEDAPEDLVSELLHERVYHNHPLGYTTIGTEKSISGFKRDDLINFLANNFTAEKTVVAVAGNINEQDALEKISKVFGSVKRSAMPIEQKPAIYTAGYGKKEKDIEQVHLCLGFPGLQNNAVEIYALACVNTVFGGGMSSRLFQKIREELGLAYVICSYSQSYDETGLCNIYAALSPENLHEALDSILGEVRGLFMDKIGSDELNRAKEQLKSNFLLSLESSSSRMSSLGRALLLLDRVITPDELIAKIDDIDLDKFYEVCEMIFKLDEMSVTLVGKQVGEMNLEQVFN